MSISKGGQSVKPYVGSKEVKEAYVGTQKVYSAAPPIYYGFLGSANDYVKADWVVLSPSYAAIVKDQGIYRIALTSPGVGTIKLNSILGTFIKFSFRSNGAHGGEVGVIQFFKGTSKIKQEYIGTNDENNYFLKSYEIPAGTDNIMIYPQTYLRVTGYVDQLRYENE